MRERMASRSWSNCLLMCSVMAAPSGYAAIVTLELRPLRSGRGPDLVQRGVGRDRLRIDAHLDHRGLAAGHAALEGGAELRGVLDDLARGAEGPRVRREVRVLQLRAAHAPRVVLLLVHA